MSVPVTSGLTLDYDASTLGLSDGDSVSGWPNRGPEGALWDLGASSFGTPTYRLDATLGPVVRMDPGSMQVDLRDSHDPFEYPGQTVMIVARWWGSDDGGMEAGGNGVTLGSIPGDRAYLRAFYLEGFPDLSADPLSGVGVLIGSGGDVLRLAADCAGDADTGVGSGTLSYNRVAIYGTDVDFARVLSWGRQLSSSEERRVLAWASQKYGLGLSCVVAPPLRLHPRDDRVRTPRAFPPPTSVQAPGPRVFPRYR